MRYEGQELPADICSETPLIVGLAIASNVISIPNARGATRRESVAHTSEPGVRGVSDSRDDAVLTDSVLIWGGVTAAGFLLKSTVDLPEAASIEGFPNTFIQAWAQGAVVATIAA